MLTEIHLTLQRILYERGQVSPREVDLRFEPPKHDWIESLTRPTINLFLFDVAENTDLRHTNMQMSRTNGHAVHRMPPRRFDLRYLVSALSTVIEDEHLLLWRTLITLLKYQHFPADLL